MLRQGRDLFSGAVRFGSKSTARPECHDPPSLAGKCIPETAHAKRTLRGLLLAADTVMVNDSE